MKFLLLDTRNDRHYTGDSTVELARRAGVKFDTAARRAVINGRPDGVTIGTDYSDDEMVIEIAKRAVHVLTRDHGFVLYRKDGF